MKIVYKDGDRVAIEMVFKQMNTKIHGPKSYLQKTAHPHTLVILAKNDASCQKMTAFWPMTTSLDLIGGISSKNTLENIGYCGPLSKKSIKVEEGVRRSYF